MKIECVKEKLEIALGKAERATGKNPTLPVLSCVLIESKDGLLSVSSTNLDIGLKIPIPAKVSGNGRVALPGHLISHFISSLYDDKTISMELKDNNFFVATSHSQTTIKTYPNEDFPSIPEILGEVNFSVDCRAFTQALKSVCFAASVSSMKSELSSVYVYNEDDSLIFVATDSFRLAEKRIKTKKLPDLFPLLIPIKNILEIIKIFENNNGDLEIATTKNQISISSESAYLTSRVVDGNFPDYRQIIPKDHKTEVIVLKQEMASGLKLTNVFSDKFNQINISVDPKNKKFAVSAKNQDVGEQNTFLDAAISGEAVIVNFNHKYLADCLQSINTDSLSIRFSGSSKPLLITGVSDRTFTYLVMPMNK